MTMPITCCASPDLIDYTHRNPEKEASSPLCFTGRPKDSHICVAECAKPGRLCRNCRRLTDTSHQES